MLAALIIVFREVFEAGLIVGIVMAVTRTVARRSWWIGGGVVGGALGACAVAIFAGALSALFGGAGQALFNAAILGVAVVMLTWHSVWMARHGRHFAAQRINFSTGERMRACLPRFATSASRSNRNWILDYASEWLFLNRRRTRGCLADGASTELVYLCRW
jgi:Na+-translocating ferredoxin:NAD+ oxidoreductase RnfD subunit